MPFAKLKEVELYYEEAGDGYPILLGHGGFSDVTEWDPQVGDLSQRYRTIRVRPPGMRSLSAQRRAPNSRPLG